MKIVMTGGGSGGHITPLLAVAHELKQLRSDCEIDYIGQTGDGLGDIPARDPSIDWAYTVRAGKLRRYHGEGWRQALDIHTMALNARDVVYVVVGLVQSYRLLRRLRPDVVFIKGGFVGVPVGLASARLGIPYVTHDSDAMPGLANRIVARWARMHAVALPKEVYAYPADRTVTVGVPISHEYRVRTPEEIADIKARLGFEADGQVVLVTGGGLGALRLNNAMVAGALQLLEQYPGLTVVHLAGRAHSQEVRKQYDKVLPERLRQRVKVEGFITNLYDYSAVADVVVTRAGGNSMAEFAAQAKACIVVPNPVLAGGHQLKNARVLTERQAVELVEESELLAGDTSPGLGVRIAALLKDVARRKQLGDALHMLARPDAAQRLAMVLLDIAKEKQHNGSPYGSAVQTMANTKDETVQKEQPTESSNG